MSNTQGRALIACTFCRQRKRRCDGQSPQCRACRLRGLQCIYVNPDPPRMEEAMSNQTSSQRMEAAESLLHRHAESIETLNQQIHLLSDSIFSDNTMHKTPSAHLSLCPSPGLGSISSGDRNDTQVKSTSQHSNDAFPPITIPIGHQTSTSDLLRSPQVGRLAGWYPDGFFLKIEEQRHRSSLAITTPLSMNEPLQSDFHVDRSTADGYLESFFDSVHPFHPFLDKDELLSQYEDTMAGGFRFDAQSTLIISVLALGATASDPIDVGNDALYTGDAYIQRALGFLLPSWAVSFRGDILMAQSLILCAIYFTYTIDPLMAWRLVHMASTNIQQSLLSCCLETPHDTYVQALIRLGWVCYIIECDVLAEFHLPRSGIELLADKMPLPDYTGPPCPRNLYVLADITARSLLNRIHHALFAMDNRTAICTAGPIGNSSKPGLPTVGTDIPLFRVCQELDSQLEAWYGSLPAAIKPDLYGRCQGNNQASLLRLRYWSAKQNIYRPLVIYVASSGTSDIRDFPPSILDKCGICLDACHAFLLTAGHTLSRRTPYTYSVAQCCLGSALILSIAAQNAVLRESKPREINPILKLAVDDILPWAQGDSSLKNVHEIASSIAAKLRFESSGSF